MDTLIQSIAQKYGKKTILEQLEKVNSDQNLKIGFIGMFSAGKTSLINALLDTKLPVDPAPTTKSLCIIESSQELTQNEYFRESGMERIPISFMDFQNLLNGNEFGVAVMRIPSQDEIPNGIVYIDTPGVDNFSAKESDLTYRYLSLLDAAVVCLDINEGTVRQSLLDFISEPKLSALSSRMLFVLTHADLKLPNAVNTIKEEITQKILQHIDSRHFDTSNLKDRIIAINANNHDSAIQVPDLIRTFILSRQQDILDERLKKEEQEIAKQLVALLQDDVENLKCDMPELNEKRKHLENEIQQIEESIEKRQKELNSLRDKLGDLIKGILMSHEAEVTSGGSNVQSSMDSINQEIAEAAKTLLSSSHLPFDIPPGAGNIGKDLFLKMQRIDNTKDLTVTAATAALTACLCPLAAPAAAAAQTAGQAAAKVAGKTAKVAGTIAGAAGKATRSATFKKILLGIGKVIHDINPLEMIGDWVSEEVKHHSFSSAANIMAIRISDNMIDLIEEPFEQTIIIPLRNQYVEREASLDALIAERKKGVRDFAAKREELLASIDQLNMNILIF